MRKRTGKSIQTINNFPSTLNRTIMSMLSSIYTLEKGNKILILFIEVGFRSLNLETESRTTIGNNFINKNKMADKVIL